MNNIIKFNDIMQAGVINPSTLKILREQEAKEKDRLAKIIREFEKEKGKYPQWKSMNFWTQRFG